MKTKLKREYKITVQYDKSGRSYTMLGSFRTKRDVVRYIKQECPRLHRSTPNAKYKIIRRYVSDWELA